MANSETILSAQTHPGDSTITAVTGEKFKGDGYYGRSDGLHTIAWSLDGFIGSIQVQGTLAIDPDETDWYPITLTSGQGTLLGTIDTTGAIISSTISTALQSVVYGSSTTVNSSYNFVGNHVWIRALIINWTDGSVNSIKLNH